MCEVAPVSAIRRTKVRIANLSGVMADGGCIRETMDGAANLGG